MTTWLKTDGKKEIELNDEPDTIREATRLGWTPKQEAEKAVEAPSRRKTASRK